MEWIAERWQRRETDSFCARGNVKSDIDGSAVISALAARVTALADRITGELTVAQAT